jgi:HPt (histidine-containing phosphotransfer) domain-containing protein
VELTLRIRAAEAEAGGRRLPILGLTADVTAELRTRCLAAGMDDVVSKPINLRRLRAALGGAVRLGGLQAPRPDLNPVMSPVVGTDRARLFDDSTYRELFADAGDDDEGRQWLNGYLEAAASSNEGIRECLASDDREALRQVAHSLAGTSLSAGAVRLGMVARDLEDAAPGATRFRLRDLVQEIIATLDLTSDEIRRFTATRKEPVP